MSEQKAGDVRQSDEDDGFAHGVADYAEVQLACVKIFLVEVFTYKLACVLTKFQGEILYEKCTRRSSAAFWRVAVGRLVSFQCWDWKFSNCPYLAIKNKSESASRFLFALSIV